MVIAFNSTSLYTPGKLCINEKVKARSMKKLSSEYKINRAADDMAGLSISEKILMQILEMNVVGIPQNLNIYDATSDITYGGFVFYKNGILRNLAAVLKYEYCRAMTRKGYEK